MKSNKKMKDGVTYSDSEVDFSYKCTFKEKKELHLELNIKLNIQLAKYIKMKVTCCLENAI